MNDVDGRSDIGNEILLELNVVEKLCDLSWTNCSRLDRSIGKTIVSNAAMLSTIEEKNEGMASPWRVVHEHSTYDKMAANASEDSVPTSKESSWENRLRYGGRRSDDATSTPLQSPRIEANAVDEAFALLDKSDPKVSSLLLGSYRAAIVALKGLLQDGEYRRKLNDLLSKDSPFHKCEQCGVILFRRDSRHATTSLSNDTESFSRKKNFLDARRPSYIVDLDDNYLKFRQTDAKHNSKKNLASAKERRVQQKEEKNELLSKESSALVKSEHSGVILHRDDTYHAATPRDVRLPKENPSGMAKSARHFPNLDKRNKDNDCDIKRESERPSSNEGLGNEVSTRESQEGEKEDVPSKMSLLEKKWGRSYSYLQRDDRIFKDRLLEMRSVNFGGRFEREINSNDVKNVVMIAERESAGKNEVRNDIKCEIDNKTRGKDDNGEVWRLCNLNVDFKEEQANDRKNDTGDESKASGDKSYDTKSECGAKSKMKNKIKSLIDSLVRNDETRRQRRERRLRGKQEKKMSKKSKISNSDPEERKELFDVRLNESRCDSSIEKVIKDVSYLKAKSDLDEFDARRRELKEEKWLYKSSLVETELHNAMDTVRYLAKGDTFLATKNEKKVDVTSPFQETLKSEFEETMTPCRKTIDSARSDECKGDRRHQDAPLDRGFWLGERPYHEDVRNIGNSVSSKMSLMFPNGIDKDTKRKSANANKRNDEIGGSIIDYDQNVVSTDEKTNSEIRFKPRRVVRSIEDDSLENCVVPVDSSAVRAGESDSTAFSSSSAENLIREWINPSSNGRTVVYRMDKLDTSGKSRRTMVIESRGDQKQIKKGTIADVGKDVNFSSKLRAVRPLMSIDEASNVRSCKKSLEDFIPGWRIADKKLDVQQKVRHRDGRNGIDDIERKAKVIEGTALEEILKNSVSASRESNLRGSSNAEKDQRFLKEQQYIIVGTSMMKPSKSRANVDVSSDILGHPNDLRHPNIRDKFKIRNSPAVSTIRNANGNESVALLQLIYRRILETCEKMDWEGFQTLVEALHPDRKGFWRDICRAVSDEAKRLAVDMGGAVQVCIEIGEVPHKEKMGSVKTRDDEVTFEIDMTLNDVDAFFDTLAKSETQRTTKDES